MKIFPAIDLRGGNVVRLTEGDYDKMKIYGGSPLDTAKKFESLGAEYLHIVDLDGAKSGLDENFNIICDIAKKTNLFIETGGGVRTEEKIQKYLDSGVKRVILGTKALEDPEFLSDMIKKYGERVAVGVDAKNEKVAVNGWINVTDVNSFDFCLKLRDMDVKTVIYTDISKDGKLSGANIGAYEKLSKIENLNIIASGGISSLDDIKALLKINCYGIIIGKAIYENKINLKEVLELSGE